MNCTSIKGRSDSISVITTALKNSYLAREINTFATKISINVFAKRVKAALITHYSITHHQSLRLETTWSLFHCCKATLPRAAPCWFQWVLVQFDHVAVHFPILGSSNNTWMGASERGSSFGNSDTVEGRSDAISDEITFQDEKQTRSDK